MKRSLAAATVTLFAACSIGTSAAQASGLHDMLIGTWSAQVPAFPGWDGVDVRFGGTSIDPKWNVRNLGEFRASGGDCDVASDASGNEPAICSPRTGEIRLARHLARLVAYEVLMHEYGHARDWIVMTDDQRGRFMAVMRYSGPWSGGKVQVEELFADAHAYCSLTTTQRTRMLYHWSGRGSRATLSMGGYGWEPTRAQARATCALIREIV